MRDLEHQVLLIGCGALPDTEPSPDAIGFKAYNLWRIDRAGMPVPQAFVLGTAFCQEYFRHDRIPVTGLRELLLARVRDLERASGLAFGSARKPLLLSVRSGAPVSMPGMLETVLDIGICDATVPGLLRLTGNARLVWDSYRRLVRSFAEVVHQLPATRFDAALQARIEEAAVGSASELDFQSLRMLTRDYLELYEELVGHGFPQQPLGQLEAAVVAVWASWAADKATEYRRLNQLSDDPGTAVTVQRMVYGNAGGTSGAGVAFTRDPASGEPALYLDFMFNAQGDDVVSGRLNIPDGERLGTVLPAVFQEVVKAARMLEKEFCDTQEFEFTVQDGKLYVLQTRTGKRTAWAALRMAIDQVDEGMIEPAVALERLSGIDLAKIQRSRVVAASSGAALCRAVGAGGGVAIGEIALDSERAGKVAALGRAAILVREGASTEDIAGIASALGMLTATGSRTAHAAVVARQLNKVCVVGCDKLSVDLALRRCTLAGRVFSEGEVLSLDGETGDVFAGPVAVTVEKPDAHLARVQSWRQARQAA